MWDVRARVRAGSVCKLGGSLVEVVIALVLLAVGLLALQALAVAASRSLGAAERTTRYANLVERTAEATLTALAMDSIPPDLDCVLPDGGQLMRVVAPGTSMAVRYQITVAPPSHLAVRRGSEITGYAFSSNGFVEASAPDPCP